MKKRWLLIVPAFLLVGLLALLLRDFVRVAVDWLIDEVNYLLWYIDPYVTAIPQLIYWALLIFFALIMLASSLVGGEARRRRAWKKQTVRPGRVGTWLSWVQQASARSSYRQFYRWRLAENLGMLARDVLAHNRPFRSGQGTGSLRAAEVDIPPEIQAYLEAGQTVEHLGRLSGLRRLLRLGARASPLDLDPEQVVRFIEEQMEV